jgi:ribosomal protein L7/L12
MSTGTQIAVGVGIALFLFAGYLSMRRRRAPHRVREISPAALTQARELVAEGRIVQAVRLIRGETGLSLADAKAYADSLASTGEPPARRPVDGVSADTIALARALVHDGKPIQAVKAVKDETGWRLERCKEVVDGLRQNP